MSPRCCRANFPVPSASTPMSMRQRSRNIVGGPDATSGNLVYLTVGTGIGGGVLIEGAPLHGLMHPEIGHIHPRRHELDLKFAGSLPVSRRLPGRAGFGPGHFGADRQRASASRCDACAMGDRG